MTLQEILKAKGMADADIEATIAEMKQNKIYTTSHENMDVRYPKLKTDHENLVAQHDESTKLIDQFKAGAKDNEALQGKITSYEAQIQQLTNQLTEQKIDSAMDRKLIAAGAKSEDLDYLKFLWKQKGEITLDDHDEIKGGDDAIAGLKTQRPGQFESDSKQKQVEPQKLPNHNEHGGTVVTKDEFNKMGYASRVELRQNNPELYAQMMKG